MEKCIKKLLSNKKVVLLLVVFFIGLMLDVLLIKNPYISALILFVDSFCAMLIFCYIIANKIE